LIEDLELERGLSQIANETETTDTIQKILSEIPFVIKFEKRVKLFRDYIEQDQRRLPNLDFQPPFVAKVRRAFLFEDGFKQLNTREIKGRVAIEFIDQHGLAEAGIDGGGVFKEFLTSCLKGIIDFLFDLILLCIACPGLI
jgi:ubiquitin-protein ligase E3 C